MAHRSAFVHFPGTWSFPGGALEAGETPVDGALRELVEEVGVPTAAVTVVSMVGGTDHGDWRYTYVLGTLNPQWTELTLTPNWETEAVKWVAAHEMDGLPLHPDLLTDLPMLRAALAAVPMSGRTPS